MNILRPLSSWSEGTRGPGIGIPGSLPCIRCRPTIYGSSYSPLRKDKFLRFDCC